MKINNLEVGQKVKNYKELCKLLELKPQGGNAKKKQMAWIEEYVNYEKEGYGFVICGVSNKKVEPMKDDRKAGNNKSPYIDIVESLILDLMLQDGKNGKLLLSKSQMFLQLKMVNQNYSVGKHQTRSLSSLIGVNENTTKDWYQSTDAMLEGNIVTALKSLSNQALVIWSKVLVVDVDTVVNGTLIEEAPSNGEVTTPTYTVKEVTKHEHRETNDREAKIILRAEKNALLELNCSNKVQVINRGLWDSFASAVKKEISERGSINYYYNSYKVLFHEDMVEDEVNKLKSNIMKWNEKEQKQNKLSEGVKERVVQNAKKRQDDKSFFGRPNNHRQLSSYVPETKKLNKTLLDQSSSDIRADIYNTKTNVDH